MKEWWVDLCPPRFLACFSTCNPSQQSMRQYLQPAQSSTLRQLHHGYIHLDLQFTRHGSNLTHPQHNHLDAGRYCKIHCITLQPFFPRKQNYSLLSSACLSSPLDNWKDWNLTHSHTFRTEPHVFHLQVSL